ncbi:flippase [Citrobacter freundii]|uniref:flippase n=2 Tax=Enterobacteriaceae TaxID=543 RepID=UPI001E3A3213|nr:flippase [Citrobacter freundii]WNT14500.1 flippase [Citrobacter freundii]
MLPYLVRVLGPSGYGSLMLALALIQYFLIATDYGFNLSSTKKIAVAKSSKEVDVIYTNTLNAKIIIFFVGIFVITPVLYFFFNSLLVVSIIFISLLAVLGNIIFPLFLYQGLERMKDIMWITMLAKVVMTGCIFIFVKNKNDLFISAFIMTFQYLIPGLLSLYVLRKNKVVKYTGFCFRSAIEELKHGKPLFLSQMAVTFYTTFNTILLGYFYNPVVVGQYVAADKMRMAAQSLLNPIQQVVFPKVNKEQGSTDSKIKKYRLIILAPSFIMAIVSLFFGQKVALLYLGNSYLEASHLFVLMMCLLPIISLSVIYGQWGLIVIGKERVLTKIYCFAAVIHAAYSVPLVIKYSTIGMVISVFLTEAVVSILMIYFFNRYKQIS